MKTFHVPCSAEHCFCAGEPAEPTRVVNAVLSWETDGEKNQDTMQVTLPASFHRGQWMMAFNCAVRERLEPLGAHFGMLKFRLDGSAEPLTFWQKVSDFWYRLTWRGKQYTGSHFVPIWPRPPVRA